MKTSNNSTRSNYTAALALGVFSCLMSTGGCSKQATEEAQANTTSAERKPIATKTGPGEVVMGAQAPELKQMKIEPVQSVTVAVNEVSATARIQANPHNVGHAVMPVPGRIVRVMARLGDTVVRGQPLVSIESPSIAEAESAYVQAEASVRQAEIGLAKAEADLARIADLYEHGAIAQKEVLAARTTDGLTRASVEQARTMRDQARRRLELLGLKAGQFQQQITVNAPIAGKVMEISVVAGEYRNEINTPLITITDLSMVWVESEVPESKIRLVQVGGIAQLELIAYPGQTFKAKVTRIADAVDSETRTVKVDAEMPNPGGKLRPDMFGSLRYAAKDAPSPWIPESAIVRLNGVDLVFVERAPGRFQSVPVELGKSENGGHPVFKGLNVGDRIVTQGAIYLKAAL